MPINSHCNSTLLRCVVLNILYIDFEHAPVYYAIMVLCMLEYWCVFVCADWYLIGLWFSVTIICCYYSITNIHTAVKYSVQTRSCTRKSKTKNETRKLSKRKYRNCASHINVSIVDGFIFTTQIFQQHVLYRRSRLLVILCQTVVSLIFYVKLCVRLLHLPI